MKPQLFFVACLLFLFGCREESKYPYAIRDFDRVFEPYLTEIVNINVVGFDSATHFVTTRMNDEGLFKLSLSEHPVLRATALRELVHRKSVDQLQALIGHLDDTASINWDRGEWGVQFRSVSDDMIKTTAFRDSAVRAVLIDSVMQSHIYLNSVYRILGDQRLPEKYYVTVRQLSAKSKPWPLEESEQALLALAAYHKRADQAFIDSVLMSHGSNISSAGLKIIQDHPDIIFLRKLETGVLRSMYKFVNGRGPSDFTAQEYFNTIAVFRNERSASLLASILHRRPILPVLQDTKTFKADLCDAILANRCPAYEKLLGELSGYLAKKRKDSIREIAMDLYAPTSDVDTSHYVTVIRW